MSKTSFHEQQWQVVLFSAKVHCAQWIHPLVQLLKRLQKSIATLETCGDWGKKDSAENRKTFQRDSTLELETKRVWAQARAPQKQLFDLKVVYLIPLEAPKVSMSAFASSSTCKELAPFEYTQCLPLHVKSSSFSVALQLVSAARGLAAIRKPQILASRPSGFVSKSQASGHIKRLTKRDSRTWLKILWAGSLAKRG